MANIDVQKKKSNPLPLILIALLVLGIIGYLVWRNGANDGAENRTAPLTTDSVNRSTTDTLRR